MRLPSCSSLAALLVCAALCAGTALGQSLSIVKKETNYWIEASAPVGNPQTLQASENLQNWVVVREDVQESYSLQLGTEETSQRYFRLTPLVETPPITVLLIGDSLASDCCGWGQGLPRYFKENVTFVNYAMAGVSTKIFLQSAEKENMLLIKPDYVLIQYAWIDASANEDRHTTLEEFGDNLRTIVEMVRGFGGIPILVTKHAALTWDANGELIPSDGDRNPITREIADELDAPLIDLYQSSTDLLIELGESGSEFMRFTFFPDDVVHLSPTGAVYVARLVASDFPGNLGLYVTGLSDPLPEPE